MIPEFPQFKKLELTDKEDVEKFTSKFPPYSDFNFVSMWSWDTKEGMRLSVLNNNLIVRFTDYITEEFFYSFLGDNEVNDTVEKLFELSKQEGLELKLKLVPEDSLKGLDLNKFKAEEDRDNFDYILSILELKNLAGGKLAKKRNQVANFLRTYTHADARIIDLKDDHIKKSIQQIFQGWLEMKINVDAGFESHEEVAVNRLFLGVDVFNLAGVGIFIGNKLVAFLVNELIEGNYAVGHASKIDKGMVGVNSFLMRENASFLSSFGKEFFNYEQDLGMDNLRDAKMRFRPSFFLKKYILTYN
jgi:hypothetical protein